LSVIIKLAHYHYPTVLALLQEPGYFAVTQLRKEGRAMTTFFRHYRRRGPVNALQMRLQG
jgi:hypothetical protein